MRKVYEKQLKISLGEGYLSGAGRGSEGEAGKKKFEKGVDKKG